MSKPFDLVVLSCDSNPKFIEFWPLVSRAWYKLFGVQSLLTVIGQSELFHMEQLREHGEVIQLDPVPGIPLPNQAKMARYWMAAHLNEVALINDLDLLPLVSSYVYQFLKQRPPDHLLTLGTELYTGKERGKFTAGYLTAEGHIWRKLVNPKRLEWRPFIESFIGVRHFDDKEDIQRDVHHEDPNTFSDESVLRYLLAVNPVPVIHAPRGYSVYTDRAIDRANWRIDPQKLANGTYVEAHLLRPWSQHKEAIEPLVKYLGL
jgi:hypothetical protein